MREIETDYLVIGAGTSGMAFVDALIDNADVEVVMVDRRHRPGGHWLDAYPFVRLHQPSANYGVSSRQLGFDRIDTAGPNAGFYERATAPEICDYFARVMAEQFLPSGRVQFLSMSDYRGEDDDGHHVVSLMTGKETVVRVRRAVVDATYVESSIPSRRPPAYGVDEDARVIPPNDLVDLSEAAKGFTVVGCGKTAMDTCNWLLDNGVDPGAIQWFRPRDPWLFTRRSFQPLDLVGSYMRLQGAWVAASAEAADSHDFARRLEADDVLTRIDESVDPPAFRGAIISDPELDGLRSIERLVRGQRVLHVGSTAIKTDAGDVPSERGQVVVDCTAPGVRATVATPVFAAGRITLQYVTIGNVSLGAATIGAVEAMHADAGDDAKNALCPVLSFGGSTEDLLPLAYYGMQGLMARSADPEVNAWTDSTRLNTARAARDHFDDPRVTDGFARIGEHFGAAMQNLARHVGAA